MLKTEVTKLHTLTGHRDCVYTLERSGVDNLFFSGAGDGMVVAWNLNNPENGELIAKLPNSVYALHHHQASNLLVAGHNYDGIHVLDWQNKSEVGSLQLTTASIFDIQSHKDDLFVATGDGTVIKVALSSLSILVKDQSSEKSARTIAIHPSNGDIAIGYSDNFIRIFDINLQLKHAWQAHANSVFTIRFTPDGHFLMSGSRDARLKVWDVNVNYLQVEEVVAHMYAINHLDFSPDNKHFVTCSMDKSLKVWKLDELRLLKVIDRARHAGHGTSVNKVLWTSHHDQLVSASDDRTISVWNIIF
ncbi:MAG TPA: WD40 repeat domain-containing protein [Ohtaekwangia sp.]|uniref:WD40 repeat domain-containing protein n=1 Tax=Ohtaekwangia sp. TaxID=2066019 RepID=UPI002F940F0A